MTRKLVYVIPRVQIVGTGFRQTELRLGKATLLLDTDATWQSRIGKPRPPCLNVYREFPRSVDDADPTVVRGTIVASDDEGWLRENVAYVVSVAYVLGIQENRWRHPAEAFQYIGLSVGDTPHDLVQFYTKTGSLIEDVDDFRLLPPLELRGVRNQFYIDTRSEHFSELSKRLERSLPDRLIVGCYHLFRTQFANGFLASVRQDYAAYCACLEAAFDTPKSQDGGATLADFVERFYDNENKVSGLRDFLRDFIRGLYEERSVFNHGVSESGLEPHRQRLLQEFRALSFRWDLLRHICVDVLIEKAREAAGHPRGDIGTFFSKTFKQIETCLSSKDAWRSLCKELTKKGSVKVILGLEQPGTDSEQDNARLSAFIELCCRFLMVHQWSRKDVGTEAQKVCASLKCLAEIIHATSGEEAVKAAATELYEAAKAGDRERLGMWAAKHAAWTMLRGCESLCDDAAQAVVAQAVAAPIARLFDCR